ncbi:MAG: hypothetical protein J7L53_07995 [Deltaproteobacteria bacterium]|nr:hypothetical protein [Deltaproteobacteria bacterium]
MPPGRGLLANEVGDKAKRILPIGDADGPAHANGLAITTGREINTASRRARAVSRAADACRWPNKLT